MTSFVRRALTSGTSTSSLSLAMETTAAPWADAGVTWLLTRLGPFRLKFDEALEAVSAGPPTFPPS